jgi:hypothetical protein
MDYDRASDSESEYVQHAAIRMVAVVNRNRHRRGKSCAAARVDGDVS